METHNETPGQVNAPSPGHTNKDDDTTLTTSNSNPGSTASTERPAVAPHGPCTCQSAAQTATQTATQAAPSASSSSPGLPPGGQAGGRGRGRPAKPDYYQNHHRRGCGLCDTIDSLFTSAESNRGIDLLFGVACHELGAFPMGSPCIVEDKAFFVSAFLLHPIDSLDHAVVDKDRMVWLKGLQYKGNFYRGALEATFHHPKLAQGPWAVPTASTTEAFLKAHLPADGQPAKDEGQAGGKGPVKT